MSTHVTEPFCGVFRRKKGKVFLSDGLVDTSDCLATNEVSLCPSKPLAGRPQQVIRKICIFLCYWSTLLWFLCRLKLQKWMWFTSIKRFLRRKREKPRKTPSNMLMWTRSQGKLGEGEIRGLLCILRCSEQWTRCKGSRRSFGKRERC